jgi:hypothetical protein
MPSDEFGYGRPPKHNRFKKGRSGNPKGRPKGAKNVKTDLEEELREQIVVREGGKRKTVSKQRAMIKGLLAKAVQGDTRAAAFIGNMALRLLHPEEIETPSDDLAAEDRAILEAHGIPVRQEAKEAETSEAEESDSGPEEPVSNSPPPGTTDTEDEAGDETS